MPAPPPLYALGQVALGALALAVLFFLGPDVLGAVRLVAVGHGVAGDTLALVGVSGLLSLRLTSHRRRWLRSFTLGRR
ncbi:MAG TPA: hypothetical protein VD838_01420 [Anaeromyxobacteraceae bacterium]|nr:hypothetical protein [Anaeromyxobacteraceae bacterium]